MIKEKCVLCRSEIVGLGNNAEPLRVGRCCDDCNKKVIAVRLIAVEPSKLKTWAEMGRDGDCKNLDDVNKLIEEGGR